MMSADSPQHLQHSFGYDAFLDDQESIMGTSKNWFSAAFRVRAKSNW